MLHISLNQKTGICSVYRQVGDNMFGELVATFPNLVEANKFVFG